MNANKTESKKAPQPRKKAVPIAERRALAAEALRKDAAAFELKRHAVWMGLWVSALELYVLVEDEDELKAESHWWFDEFAVDVVNKRFTSSTLGENWITEAELTATTVSRLQTGLETGFSLVADYKAEQERKRLEAEALKAKKVSALSKLTPEEQEVLGVAHLGRFL